MARAFASVPLPAMPGLPFTATLKGRAQAC